MKAATKNLNRDYWPEGCKSQKDDKKIGNQDNVEKIRVEKLGFRYLIHDLSRVDHLGVNHGEEKFKIYATHEDF